MVSEIGSYELNYYCNSATSIKLVSCEIIRSIQEYGISNKNFDDNFDDIGHQVEVIKQSIEAGIVVSELSQLVSKQLQDLIYEAKIVCSYREALLIEDYSTASKIINNDSPETVNYSCHEREFVLHLSRYLFIFIIFVKVKKIFPFLFILISFCKNYHLFIVLRV